VKPRSSHPGKADAHVELPEYRLHRGGIKIVLLPKENEKDVSEIPQQVLKKVTLIQVQTMDEVLKQALVLRDPDAFFPE
jgi:predicted ATP-dependent protease